MSGCSSMLILPSGDSVHSWGELDIDWEATVIGLVWKKVKLHGAVGSLASHSLLELHLEDGTVYHTEKFARKHSADQLVSFGQGAARGQVIRRGSVGKDGLIKLDSLSPRDIQAKDVKAFVRKSKHMTLYDVKRSNCHHYVQDIWNFCVTYWNRRWWRPDMLKARVFGSRGTTCSLSMCGVNQAALLR
eukprot:TRINITY_DN59230_c0_g1_i1.p1 TRINITY_DN59230_c0_g1~~TRINITY_DN59230_c0_g1_i1.p1  ORF type:complete len:188 (+),score=10.93 TRINITY_DN59230_c0_g1_i1:84-647(+)